MTLAVGTRLGPYEIQRQIGAGGMGEVYGALDPRLGRSVAIKVLPPELRAHADRLRRFEQEARTIGALNHPNLLTLHDVGEYDGAPYLVTELLDGRSLRQALHDGTLSVRETTRISREIARGLAAAHSAGVVHRDIKPDNLFLTADARVKILDFGIAKLRDDENLNSGGTRPGLGLQRTQAAATEGTGMVIGTPGYMAPEQLAGKAVDPRTDIFALGVVIYEMVAGQRPFAGEGHVEESYAILKSDPPPLPPTVPAALERIILRCLEKRAAARFQSASDLAFALESLESSGEMALGRAQTPAPMRKSQPAAEIENAATAMSPAVRVHVPVPTEPMLATVSTPTPTPYPAPAAASASPASIRDAMPAPTPIATSAAAVVRTSWRWPAIAAVTSALAIAAGVVAFRATRHPAPASAWPDNVLAGPVFRRITYRAHDQWFARFAPNATSVLYSVRESLTDDWHIYRSSIEHASVEAVNLSGRLLSVSGAGELALSTPWHAGTGGILSIVEPGNGTPRKLGEGVSVAAWGPDNKSLAVTRKDDKGSTIEYPLGTTVWKQPSGTIPYLAVSPDGQRIAFCELRGAHEARGRIVVIALDGNGGAKEIASSTTHASIRGLAWAPSGNDVWFSTSSGDPDDSAIHALESDGGERVLLHTASAVSLLDVARDGRMLVTIGDARTKMMLGKRREKQDDLAWFDGSDVQSISADGKMIAFVEATGTGQTIEGHAAYIRRAEQDPVLVGHASRITIVPDAGGGESSSVIEMVGNALQRVPIDSATTTTLPSGPVVKLDPTDRMAVSWNGKYLVVRGEDASATKRLWLWDLAGGGAPRAIGPAANTTGYHPISSDGQWIALPHAGGGLELVPIAGGASRVFAAPVADELDEPLSFTADGQYLIAMAQHKYPRKVYRLALADSTPTWEDWTALDIPSKPTLFEPAFSADGETVAYSYSTEASDLYVIERPGPVR